jgi:hypothetical protein
MIFSENRTALFRIVLCRKRGKKAGRKRLFVDHIYLLLQKSELVRKEVGFINALSDISRITLA